MTGESALWAAVLRQSVEDAKAPRPEWVERDWKALAKSRKQNAANRDRKATPAEIRRAYKRAYENKVLEWQRDREYVGSYSFRLVCDLAGIDPDAAEDRMRAAMTA